MDTSLTKDEMRKAALAARTAIPDRARREAAIQSAIADLVASRFQGGVVAAYVAMRDEVDPLPGLVGHTGMLALPVVVGPARPLVFRRWSPTDALEAGAFGTRHPVATGAEIRPDLVLVPLAGFDRHGQRLGYGGGFYDRTLAQLRAEAPVMAVGIAFDVQEVGVIPAEVTDEPLDAVICEDGLRRFGTA